MIRTSQSLGLQICGPALHFLQQICIFTLLGSPALDTVLQLWSHKHWVKRNDHLPDQLTTAFLMQPRMPLAFFAMMVHCWLMTSLASIRIPRYFSVNLLFSWWAPRKYWCLWHSYPDAELCIFPLPNSMRFPSAQFSSTFRFLWMAAQPSGLSPAPLNIYPLQSYQRCTLSQYSGN